MSIKVGWRGRLYEDFQVGDVYEHPLGRTILAADNSWFSLLTMGGNGFSKDFPVERYYRDAPLLVIGGGTNELQRLIIARQLLQKYAIA